MLPRDLAPGAAVDGFVLKERIAVGGMGAIWSVEHPDHSGPLVMKLPFLGAGADVSTIIGYETEAMILRRLSGRHVPAFVAAGDLAVLPYIVMERVSGTPLDERLRLGPMAVEEVARVGARIAAAVEDIHRQHVVHLDLKTGNVILLERGAVLIDFGLARHDELPDLFAEESDLPMGSPATISPEQLVGDRTQPASDIFALGCVLYEMATGEPPFGEPVSLAGQKRRLFAPPRPPRSLDRKVPRWMQEIILKCLEVEAGRRYASAGQLLFDLRHPDQVPLTERADRAGQEGFTGRIRGWLGGRRAEQMPPQRKVPIARRISTAPVVMAAVDLARGADPLANEVRLHVRRVLDAEEGARLACVTVLKTKLVGDDDTPDEAGRSAYLARLIALKDWARTLDVPEERVSFHVLEAVNPGDAILDYASHNRVDHIVMGARAASALRRHLGSVSSHVVAEALCSVTVVRLKESDASE
ncbi:bifunctional serine/threonine-protein kinase/universal stress protein [Chthonobacter rhizosphaerae]|uniref:bifunctional serine/threonine-protein kinase/universal stress protein n=1 Tax=Chthonobacter rhizosphaerae TaxID=2735553 RepID=UPI0015EF5D85|nr:bifunctional serine/threonine-protein kinase/universal stress protein [Chthonobacter rhizosphaerae]